MPFPSNTSTIPRNLDMEYTLMRRTEGFDHCVSRSSPTVCLQMFLEHRFVIRLGGTQRVGALQFIPQRVTNKFGCCFESTIKKDRARNCLKHVGQQRILLPAATLLFTTTET